MMIKGFFLLTVASLLLSFKAKEGAKHNHREVVDGIAKVTFPYPATRKDTLGLSIYQCEDSLGFYAMLVQKYYEPLFFIHQDSLDNFYNGFINGMLNPEKGKLVSRQNFKFEGLKAVKFSYLSKKDDVLALKTVIVLYVNKMTVVQMVASLPNNQEAIKPRADSYFGSLKILLPRESRYQGTTTLNRVGMLLGYYSVFFVFFGTIILVVLLGFWLAGRRLKRRNVPVEMQNF